MISDSGETSILEGNHEGFYVTIEDDKAKRILKEVGFFGVELANVLRKETYRRGQLDLQLSSKFGSDTTCSVIILDLLEAFYLLNEKDCLIIRTVVQNSSTCDSNLDSNLPSSHSWWKTFSDVYKNSSKILDFAIEYCVYHQFRTQGWIVKSGFNYGVDFLLYKNDPSEEHSQYAVTIISELNQTDNTNTRYSWKSLLGFHRVVQSVNKQYLLVYVSAHEEEPFIDLTSQECLNNMTLRTRLFMATSNTLK